MAKTVNDTYKKINNGKSWHELDWVTQESNRATADSIPAKLKLAGLNNKNVTDTALTENAALFEILAQTEHLRWNAFHAAMGYRRMSIEEMNNRFNKTGNLEYARKDANAKLHVCLVPWDQLDEIKEVYRKLAQEKGDEKEQKRDFKENDRDMIRNIPQFLGII